MASAPTSSVTQEDAANTESPKSASGARQEGQTQHNPAPDSTRRHSYACPPTPPSEFFCPMTNRLMTEPVTLLNTGVTVSRTALQAWLQTGSRVCPVTGQELVGWVLVESNVRLRARIRTWATEQGLNFELLDSASALLVELREPLLEQGGR